MAIKSVHLINFKSHLDTTIELSSGLTCLIGSGNVGKSAFIGGLRWVLQNEVAKDFITWGKTKSSVAITFDSSVTVERGRDGKINYYNITYPNGKVEEFKSFGTEVPKQVEAVMSNVNLSLDVDKKINLNIIRQHDGLFLLNEGGSVRNKVINAVIGMQYIDSAIRSLAPEIKSAESRKEKINIEIAELNTKIGDLGDINKLEETIAEIKSLLSEAGALESIKENLEYIIKLSDDVEERLEFVHYKQSQCPNKVDVDKFVDCVDKVKSLSELVGKVDEFEDRYSIFKTKKKQYEYLDEKAITLFDKTVSDYEKLHTLHNTAISFEERHKKFQDKKKEYEKIDADTINLFEVKVNDYERLLPIYSTAESFKDRHEKFLWKKKQIGEINQDAIERYFLLVDKYKNLITVIDRADVNRKSCEDVGERKGYAAMETSSSKLDFIEAIKEVETCPFCSSKIDESKAELIAERS